MTPTTANRVADAARTVLSKLIHDVYIYTDHFRGSDAGRWVCGFLGRGGYMACA